MAWYWATDAGLDQYQCSQYTILENFLQNILWGLLGFAYTAYTTYTIISLL